MNNMTPKTPDDFEKFERLDEEQIEAEINGELVDEYVYQFTNKQGRKVVGISYACCRDWAQRHGNLVIRDVKLHKEDDLWYCDLFMDNLLTRQTVFAIAEQPTKDQAGKIDPFARRKALSKAKRNAYRDMMPETYLKLRVKQLLDPSKSLKFQIIIDRLMHSTVKTKTGLHIPASGFSVEELVEMEDEKAENEQVVFNQSDNVPIDIRTQRPGIEPGTAVDDKAYADEVSSKREWRHRCYELAKDIAKQRGVGFTQETYEEAFRQSQNVIIEEASIERLTEWLAYLSAPQGNKYIVEFCQYNAKLEQESLAEDQRGEWLQKCLDKAEELGFDAELHNKAYFRIRGHKFEEATIEQLEVWYNFLEFYGQECLSKIALESERPTTESPMSITATVQEQPEPDELQVRRICASIRMLWAKLPDYNNLKHRTNSIKQHIGDFPPSALSECKDLVKLQEYEQYLKGQIKS